MNSLNNCSGHFSCPPAPKIETLPTPGPVPFLQLEPFNSNDMSHIITSSPSSKEILEAPTINMPSLKLD